jgi:hypothetical protein
MKPKPKIQKSKVVSKMPVRKMKTNARRAKAAQKFNKHQREIAARVWSRITNATKFVQASGEQASVTFKLPSGEVTSASLKWFIFSHGPRVFGHYDDANDTCYISKIIE